jgi:hypothetical protein
MVRNSLSFAQILKYVKIKRNRFVGTKPVDLSAKTFTTLKFRTLAVVPVFVFGLFSQQSNQGSQYSQHDEQTGRTKGLYAQLSTQKLVFVLPLTPWTCPTGTSSNVD